MADKSIRQNYIFNLLYQILTVFTPLVTTPYISRVLGADGIGKYSFAMSIVSYFNICAVMGTTIYAQREISYNQTDIKNRSIVFWNVVTFRTISTIICMMMYLLSMFIFGYQEDIFFIMMFNILYVAIDISWFFQGLEEFKKIAVRDTIFKIITIALIFLLVKTKDDLLIYTFLMSGITVFSAFLFWIYIPQYIVKIPMRLIKPFGEFKIIFSMFIPTIAIQVYTVLDKTLIGLITDSTFENGYYEQALKISRILQMVVTSLGTVMIPRIGHYFSEGRHEDVRKCMNQSYRFVLFIGFPLCFGLIGIADNMVPWFFGPGYDKVIVLLKIFSFLILAIGISNITGMQYFIPTKRQGLLTKSVVCGAIVNFILNIVLIPKWGCVGAAIASFIAECSVTIYQIMCVRRELNYITIFVSGWRYYLAAIIMLVILGIEKLYLVPSVVNTFILMISGAFIYFIILIIFRDQFLKENISNIIKKIKKK